MGWNDEWSDCKVAGDVGRFENNVYKAKSAVTDIGSYVDEIGTLGTGNDQFDAPFDITNDGTYLYICDMSNRRIKKRYITDPPDDAPTHWQKLTGGFTCNF